MSIILFDLESSESGFSASFWNWHAIVEAVRRTHVLPDEQVDLLHQPFVGELDESAARKVAHALRDELLTTLSEDERLLLDGTTTTERDDRTLHHGDEWRQNYSTNRDLLEQFTTYCETCRGFRIG